MAGPEEGSHPYPSHQKKTNGWGRGRVAPLPGTHRNLDVSVVTHYAPGEKYVGGYPPLSTMTLQEHCPKPIRCATGFRNIIRKEKGFIY